ncbi:acyl carrier protein [Streptomyces sp. NBC_00878]|uniref:acyl carrier protein n=1 Tax=Streptomyces sp. NBC_00878 TaxID=2975854 RepID=UPI002254D14F|nr:acyl carrier protein [Streptomyces sp. NBC_00878]MCX4904257.1 acyl carrier protein [Streptomyces sp. NBC_00878]
MNSTTEQRLVDVLVDRLGLQPDELTRTARFKDDLGLDSLDLVELVSAMEDELGVPVTDEVALSLTSLGDVIAYVDSQCPVGTEPAITEPAITEPAI